jgi:transcriptional regulator with XRE-family HTH domain
MAALTEFGAKCRALRSGRDKLMVDQAKALGMSSAFISAVETGAKPIPANYIERVASWLSLPRVETDRLQEAADASRKTVTIRPKSGASAKMVVELAKSIEHLSPVQIRQLRLIINHGVR